MFCFTLDTKERKKERKKFLPGVPRRQQTIGQHFQASNRLAIANARVYGLHKLSRTQAPHKYLTIASATRQQILIDQLHGPHVICVIGERVNERPIG